MTVNSYMLHTFTEKVKFLKAPQPRHSGSQQQMESPPASSCSGPGWSGYTRSGTGTVQGNEKEVLRTICCPLRRDPRSAEGEHQQCDTRCHPALLKEDHDCLEHSLCLKHQDSNPHTFFPLKLFPPHFTP